MGRLRSALALCVRVLRIARRLDQVGSGVPILSFGVAFGLHARLLDRWGSAHGP